MLNTGIGCLAVALLCASAPAQEKQGRGTTVIERAPADRSIAIPREKLVEYFHEMDVKKLQTLRLIEGGKYSINIRRITNAETALVHPATIDVWVVLEGSGTMTTGGTIAGGKIVGGVTNPLQAGDVQYIPPGIAHGVSGVSGSITWLNVRWDTDWPAGAPMGAGNAPRAPVGQSIYIPKEKLDADRRDMEAKGLAVLRLIEGGHFNVNIRRIKEPSTEFHATTADAWVILEGSGTASTGFSTDKGDAFAGSGKRVEGTGAGASARVGDLFFVPAHFTHGFGAVGGVVAWLNIRWDTNYR